MALTRKMLKAMGIEPEQIDQIIEAHSETVEALKEERDGYQEDASKLKGVQKELDDLKAKGDDGLADKLKKVEKEYADYKAGVEAKDNRAARETAFRDMLKASGYKAKYHDLIMRAEAGTIDGLTMVDGKIADGDKIAAKLNEAYADFVETKGDHAREHENPPGNNNADKDPFEAGFDGE